MLKKKFPPVSKTNLSLTAAQSQRGFSLVELLIVIVIIGIIVSIAIPNLLASRRAANEASAVSAMRTIYSGQTVYYYSAGNGSYGTLTDLQSVQVIDVALGTAPFTKSGYVFNVNALTLPNDQPGYDATARPQNHILVRPVVGTGTKDFGLSESGVIYQTTDATAVTFDLATRVAQGSSVPIQ